MGRAPDRGISTANHPKSPGLTPRFLLWNSGSTWVAGLGNKQQTGKDPHLEGQCLHTPSRRWDPMGFSWRSPPDPSAGTGQWHRCSQPQLPRQGPASIPIYPGIPAPAPRWFPTPHPADASRGDPEAPAPGIAPSCPLILAQSRCQERESPATSAGRWSIPGWSWREPHAADSGSTRPLPTPAPMDILNFSTSIKFVGQPLTVSSYRHSLPVPSSAVHPVPKACKGKEMGSTSPSTAGRLCQEG